ncbi:MAG: hypothetical protein R2713_10885 [Ilumatobacteraceae bacterium]
MPVKTGDPSGASLVFAGLEQYLRTEERSLRPTLQTLAAEVCLDLGDERVFAMLDAAEHDARPRHELWWMPETMRIRALALSVTGDVEAALDVARAAQRSQRSRVRRCCSGGSTRPSPRSAVSPAGRPDARCPRTSGPVRQDRTRRSSS